MPTTHFNRTAEASMSDVQMVKNDAGGVNARILAREVQADFRRVETASIKMRARFTSAEGKRLFVRMFNTLQLNAHFISVIARTRLDHSDVTQVEDAIRAQLDALAAGLNEAFDGAEALFKANGVSDLATCDTVPLETDVQILSSFGRRYLEALMKLDQFMPLLQTLEIYEILTTQQVDAQRAALKRQVRRVAGTARFLAVGIRRRMKAVARDAGPSAVDADEDVMADESADALPSTASEPAEGSGKSAVPLADEVGPSVASATP
jgi:hypothetical protein